MVIKRQRRLSGMAIICFFISLALSAFVITMAVTNKINVEKLQMEQLILEKSLRINEVISKLLYKTEALSAIAVHGIDDIDLVKFDEMAPFIADDPAILNVLIAPNGVVTHAYSPDGGDRLLGFDFFAEATGNREALMAVEMKQLVMAGPFIARQGDWVLAGRLPVFLNSTDGDQVFWGIVSVTLRFPQALDAAELDDFSKRGFAYELWRIDPDTDEHQVLQSNLEHVAPASVFIDRPVQVMNAEWQLRVSLVREWYNYPEHIAFMVLGLFISALVAVIVQARTETEKAVREAAKAKSIFLANMSHEIRTPLNGVIGFSELAMGNVHDHDAVKDRLVKINNSAHTLLDIINGILDISKIESGKLEFEKITFDLADVLAICKSILNPEEKGVILAFCSEPLSDARLVGDPVKLRQVLLNLLSNAIKFTDHGSVKLTTSIESRTDSTVAIRFEVKDNGIGMTDEEMKNIFKAFAQSDVSTTRKYGGTGLGLAISKSYVELMGGALQVESSPGLGSRFYFTLTFDTTTELLPADIPVLEQPMFSAEVLVCEDNPDNQEVIVSHLEMVGISVTLAENGQQGLEYAQTKQYDLILMDIHMPVMDGVEATKKIVEAGILTPIVAITANIMLEDRARYLSAGMADCLNKPFTQRDLWACLMKYLTPVDTGRAADTPVAEGQYSAPINIALGIERAAKDEAMFKRFLYKFLDRQRTVFDQIKSVAAGQDYKQAHKLAHKEKNAALLIGADKLAETLFELEKVFEGGEAPEEMMDAYSTELDNVLKYISGLKDGDY